MGVIQNSINQIIGSTTQAAGIAKGVKELKRKNDLEVASVKSDIAEDLTNINKDEIAMNKEEAISKGALKEAKGELDSIDNQLAFNHSPQLLQKRAIAAYNVEEQKKARTLQKKDFAAKRETLQARRNYVDTKAKAYGIDINELIKGGKK